MSSLNGEVTVQLVGAHPAVWTIGDGWAYDETLEPWTNADIDTWVFKGPLLI